MINSQTIPAWLVAFFMVSTGLMWILSRYRQIRMDSRALALTFILEGIVYGLFNFFEVDVEIRGFFVRLMLILLSLSQFLPLAVSFARSIKKDGSK